MTITNTQVVGRSVQAERKLELQLDAANFFLADVRGGLGSFVTVFLVTAAGWSSALVGEVLTVSGLVGIISLTPVGALIDRVRAKRELLVIAVAVLAACAIATERRPTVPVIFTTDVVMAVLGGIFAPTVAALSLGLVALDKLARRTARNAVFDRAGNIVIAALVGLVGWWLGQRATFYLVPLFAVVSAFAVLSIPKTSIDHEQARGFAAGQRIDEAESVWTLLIGNRPLLMLSLFAAVFHFANGSMLALVGQRLGLTHPGLEAPLLSGCILIAQAVTIPVAILVGRRVERWSIKTFLLIACAAVIVRAGVFALTAHPVLVIAAQALDGVSTGIWDVLTPVLIADFVVGSGRYSTSRGFLGTVQGIGGSLSFAASGALVTGFGYGPAFAGLALVGLVAGVLASLLPPPEAVEAERLARAHTRA